MSSVAAQTPEASSNSISRIFGVLFGPKDTFAAIAQRPTWLAPVLLGVIIGLALITVFTNRVGWAVYMQHQNSTNAAMAQRLEQMSPEQRQQTLNLQVKIAEPVGFALAVVGPFLFTAFLAAIFLGLFNLVYGAGVGFKTSMAIVAYAFVPRMIYSLLGIFVIFLKDPTQVDLQNLIASNPGALMSTETARWMVVLATQFDVFTIWIIILLAMGYHAANPKKVSTGGAIAGIVGLWLFWVIVITGITALTS
jgi:hypothetical protein